MQESQFSGDAVSFMKGMFNRVVDLIIEEDAQNGYNCSTFTSNDQYVNCIQVQSINEDQDQTALNCYNERKVKQCYWYVNGISEQR